jgi:hypothetical protein
MNLCAMKRTQQDQRARVHKYICLLCNMCNLPHSNQITQIHPELCESNTPVNTSAAEIAAPPGVAPGSSRTQPIDHRGGSAPYRKPEISVERGEKTVGNQRAKKEKRQAK